jgi:hypothetical protein
MASIVHQKERLGQFDFKKDFGVLRSAWIPIFWVAA